MAKKGVLKSQVVGTIGIKVQPVLDDFRRELRQKLERLDPRVEARVDFDGSQARRDLNRAVRVAEKGVKNAKVGVDLSANRKEWNDSLRATREALAAELNDHKKGLAQRRRMAVEAFGEPKYAVDMEPDRRFFEKTRTMLDGFFEREYTGKVRFELDENSDRGWNALERRIDKAFSDHDNYVFHVRPQVDVETGAIDAALHELKTEFRRRAFHGEDFNIQVKPEMSDHELREVGRKLNHFKDKWDDTELEFKLSLDHSARYIAAARLAYLARDRWVKFSPFLDNKAVQAVATTLAALSGGRLASDLSHNIWDLVKNLDKATPVFGLFSSGVAGLAAGSVKLLQNTIGVAGSFGQILQMVGLLGPGFLAAGGVLGAAFVVPLMKSKDHIQGILDDWTALSNNMGSAFWVAAMSDFEDAHARAFTVFDKDMSDLSKSAGKHFGRLSDAISRIVSPKFNQWVEHASRGLDVLGDHSDSLATVVDILGRHGSASLERFLGFLGESTSKYAKWLDQAERSGKLQSMIDRGIESTVELGRATLNFGKVFGGVYEVVSRTGGADMRRFADGLDHWQQVTHSAGFQTGLSQWLRGMDEGWTNLRSETADEFNQFWKDWSRLVDKTGGLMGSSGGKLASGLLTALSGPKLNKGFLGFFEGLNDGLDRLDATWPRVSGMFGDLLSFMGSLGRGFSPVVASTLEAFARGAERLEGPLSRTVETSGPRMANMIDLASKSLTPLLEGAANLLDLMSRIPGSVELAMVAFAGFKAVSSAGSLLGAGKEGFSGIFGDFAKGKSALASLFGKGGTSAITEISKATPIILGGTTAVSNGMSTVATVGGKALGALKGVAGVLAGPLGVALAVGGVALYEYGQHQESMRQKAEDLRKAVDDVAKGVVSDSEQISAALASIAKPNEFFKNQGGSSEDIKKAFEFLNFGKGTQFMRRTIIGNVADNAGDALADQFRNLGLIATTSTTDAARGLRGLRDAYLEADLPAAEFSETVRKQMSAVPELGSGMVNLADYLGYPANEYGALTLLMSDTNIEMAMQAEQARRVAESTETLNAALDASTQKYGMSHTAAASLVESIEGIAPQMMSMSAAVEAEADGSRKSIDQVVASLQEQASAQAQWAENVTRLAGAGVAQQFLDDMSRLPEGAAYIQDLVAIMDEGTTESKARFAELIVGINEVSPALDGVVSDSAVNFQRLKEEAGLSFQGLLDQANEALEHLPTSANLAGVRTVDELVARLSEAGVRVYDTGSGLGFEFGNGLDQAVSWISEAGNNAGVTYTTSVAGVVTRDAGHQVAGDYAAGANEALSTIGADTDSVFAGFTEKVQTYINYAKAVGVGQDWNRGMAEGLANGTAATGAAETVARDVVSKTKSTMGVHSPSTIGNQIGVDWNAGIKGGLTSSSSEVTTAARVTVTAAILAAKVAAWPAKSIGTSIGEGIESGINGMARRVATAAANMVTNALDAARAAGEINSPSKKAVPIGQALPEGTEVGIRKGMPSLLDTAGAMTAGVLAQMNAANQRVSEISARTAMGSVATRFQASNMDALTVVAVVDPRSFEGAVMPIVVDGEQFSGFVEGVSAGVVRDYDSVGGR